MKKLLMSLAIFGCMNMSANAQQKESEFAKNYPVCSYKHGYNICTKQEKNAQLKKLQLKENVAAPLPSTNQVIFVRCRSAADEPSVSYNGPYRHHNIIVDDDMDNPYKGKPSKQYDGPVKNEERNINVNQTSIDLPPNNGYTAK